VLDRNPCGSSAGSGAAVAAGLATVAIGSETDGSIICPAAMNGIVGIKPEGIGIILGVNALLDMCRTSLNVGGDLAMAVVVSRQGGGQDAENETLGDAVG
jgi:amidase